MPSIAFLDESFPFTGETLHTAPVGGVATALVGLAEALAARGHKVSVFGRTDAPSQYAGVRYRPLSEAGPERFDLVIANSAPRLFRTGMGRRYALWLHNPANFLRKPRHFLPYLRFRPTVIFLGAYHRQTWMGWLPLFRGLIIPHGLSSPFIDLAVSDEPPPPRAIFISNPRRGLEWLTRLWVERIRPAAPAAELHVYASHVTYGVAKDDGIAKALATAASCDDDGVFVHDPLPKGPLAEKLAASRAMLYRGDSGETFCFAAAEASALGVPLVTVGLGSLGERVNDGVTGVLAPNEDDFVAASVAVLTDDATWRKFHAGALAARALNTWAHRAEQWEKAFF